MDRVRLAPLRATLRRFRANPFTRPEVEELWATLSRLEEEVEALGAKAAAERVDVEWIEQPLVRVGLWMTGTLAARETKERQEYDEALALTMAKGDAARKLRGWLEALPALPYVTDERVAGDLERVRARDLQSLPSPTPGLEALRERVHLGLDLNALGGLCKQVESRAGLRRTRGSSLKREFGRLRRRLRSAGQLDLAERLEASPSDDPYQDRQQLRELRKILGSRANAHRVGLAAALRDIVRAEPHPTDGVPRGPSDFLPPASEG
jgi:hypothetical protein